MTRRFIGSDRIHSTLGRSKRTKKGAVRSRYPFFQLRSQSPTSSEGLEMLIPHQRQLVPIPSFAPKNPKKVGNVRAFGGKKFSSFEGFGLLSHPDMERVRYNLKSSSSSPPGAAASDPTDSAGGVFNERSLCQAMYPDAGVEMSRTNYGRSTGIWGRDSTGRLFYLVQ